MRLRNRLVVVLVLIGVSGAGGAAQNAQPKAAPRPAPSKTSPAGMTNADVVKMVKAGLGEPLIIGAIRQAERREFSLNADGLIELKTAGVSDNIISVMLDPTATPPPPTAVPTPVAVAAPVASASAAPTAPTAAADVPPVKEVGVYYKNGGEWADLPPEVVNWKTGGVLKHLASGGIIKGDVNGLINGPSSKTLLKSPIQILVYSPEGTAITEYQLLRLHQQGKGREFRTVTGGVLHVEGGATRDLLTFESSKIAPRTYTVTAPPLGSGEFGILAPGAVSSNSASAQLGKMYTFRIQ